MILILCDENMPAASHRFLVEKGYDVKYIRGVLAGISDIEVCKISEKEGRVIITFDSDFGTLIFKNNLTP